MCARILLLLVLTGSAAAVSAQQPRPGAFELPSPKYSVRVEQSIWIPMHDGVRLSTDIYFPVNAESGTLPAQLPVIAIRTPYNKRRSADRDAANFFAGQGFIVAVEDSRGRFESEGLYEFNQFHRADGYDTIEWLGKQSWSNGKVGTYGCS